VILPPLRPLSTPTTLLLLSLLAACGGGGGSSSGLTPQAPTYSKILFGSPTTIDGTLQNYRLTTAQITPATGGGDDNKIEGTVSGSSGHLASITITVTFEGNPLFTETFDAFADRIYQPLAPLTYRYQEKSVPAGDAGATAKISFFEPQALGLTYSALGLWECEGCVTGTASVGGYFSMGAITQGSDIPISGSATYNGKLIGTYADGSKVYEVGAMATATADYTFTSPSVSLTTNNTVIVEKGTTTQINRNDLNLSGTLTYPGGTNHLTGTLTTGSGMTGPAAARFYGPQAAELGGTFFVKNTGNTEQMVGGFALKKE
jgi:hypothetical protein